VKLVIPTLAAEPTADVRSVSDEPGGDVVELIGFFTYEVGCTSEVHESAPQNTAGQPRAECAIGGGGFVFG